MRLTLLILMLFQGAWASSYFVDFSGGNDANNGTSSATPWQHGPGDSNAILTPAGKMLQPGDVVNHKGGVQYLGDYGGGASPLWNGTALNPITFQSGDIIGWGTGRAIMEGTHGGITNGAAWLSGSFNTGTGNHVIISGFEIRDYTFAGVQNQAITDLTITNCIIHHIGDYPAGVNGDGYGVRLTPANANTICVSNLIYDCNETAIYPNASTNIIIWGNELTNIQDHAIIGGLGAGWLVVVGNKIHDQTNTVTHDDAMHFTGWGNGTNLLIVANNTLYNNSQDIFLNASAICGTAYIFNNILSCDSVDGNGDDGYNNGIVINTQQFPWNQVFVFNNTVALKNQGSGGLNLSPRGGSNKATNFYDFNNIWWQSFAPTANAAQVTNILHIYAGYNCFTNALRGPSFGAGTNDFNSPYGYVNFFSLVSPHYPASDWHQLAYSVGIGSGTNLTTGGLISSSMFSFLPSAYQIDPTKDFYGTNRVSVWDCGALAVTHSLPQITGLCCH